MSTSKASAKVGGKTVRLAWTEGPTQGTTQAHHFFADGTVEWHSVGGGTNAKKGAGDAAKPAEKPERPKFMATDVGNDVCLVSYLSRSGYTLTVALDFADGSTVGVASNDKTWVPVRGTFEVEA